MFSLIDPNTEELISLADAGRLPMLRRCGRYTPAATVHRWVADGVRGVRLESMRVGARIYTSQEAVERFLTSLNPRQEAANATN